MPLAHLRHHRFLRLPAVVLVHRRLIFALGHLGHFLAHLRHLLHRGTSMILDGGIRIALCLSCSA